MRTATLYYNRPPDRVTPTRTQVIEDTSDLVILQHKIRASKPLEVNGSTVLDSGYDAVWFVYRGQYHDIGIISDPTGRFTGYYCDAILPISDRNGDYEIRDLFLDLWITPDGRTTILDEDELEEAVSQGWISHGEALIAREEMDRMVEGVRGGYFPPSRVRHYATSKS
jgi:predicted RNA-binding protein associated with RNAse of E/G family